MKTLRWLLEEIAYAIVFGGLVILLLLSIPIMGLAKSIDDSGENKK